MEQNRTQTCQGCTCKENGKDLEKKLNNILKKTVTKLLVGLSQVLITFTKPRPQGEELDEKAKMETIVRTIGETLDKALESEGDTSDTEGDYGGISEDDTGEAAAVERSGATSEFTQAKGKRKRKKKRRCQ